MIVVCVCVVVCALYTEPPALMVRLDAVTLSSPQTPPSSPPPPSPSPSVQIHLHGLLLDSLSTLSSSSAPFLCSPLASLPTGVGVGVVNTVDLRYLHSLKVIQSLSACRKITNFPGKLTYFLLHCLFHYILTCIGCPIGCIGGVCLSLSYGG